VTAKPVRIPSGRDELAAVLHLPAERPCPCVVTCHGMGASKDSEKYVLVADELTRVGLAVVRFDFRGSGESGGRYEDATIASRVADLVAVLDHFGGQPELDGRFGLLGSSLGGFVALWTVAQRRTALPIVTWNAPADLRGVQVDPSDPHGPGAALVAEVRGGRHAAAPSGVSHLLVVQGGRDEVVPAAHGQMLYGDAAAPKQLELIEGADHRLSDPRDRWRALDASRTWLVRHLGSEAA